MAQEEERTKGLDGKFLNRWAPRGGCRQPTGRRLRRTRKTTSGMRSPPCHHLFPVIQSPARVGSLVRVLTKIPTLDLSNWWRVTPVAGGNWPRRLKVVNVLGSFCFSIKTLCALREAVRGGAGACSRVEAYLVGWRPRSHPPHRSGKSVMLE